MKAGSRGSRVCWEEDVRDEKETHRSHGSWAGQTITEVTLTLHTLNPRLTSGEKDSHSFIHSFIL